MTDPEIENELARSRDRVRRLEAVVEAALMVNSTLDLAQLAEHIVDIATRLIDAERGSLFLVDPEGGGLSSMVAQGVAPGGLRLEFGEGIVGAVAASGEAVILDNPYADPRFDSTVDRATGFQTRSLLTVPVRDGEGALVAVLQLLNRRRGDFSRADVEFLAELGVPFAIALTTAHLHAEIVVREQLSREMKLAAEIQRTLQPAHRAEIPGLEITVLATPSREVGGDYWDVIPIGEGRWWIIVADVSGKGVAAGMVASNLQACLWSRRSDEAPLTAVTASVNDLLCRLTRGRKYATLAVIEWDASRECLTLVNAGHLPIFLKRDGEIEEYGATGRPIGLLTDQTYEEVKIDLRRNDTTLLYTDGLYEAGYELEAGEFGFDRIRECLAVADGPREVIESLETALAEHLAGRDVGDDVTLLCFRYNGPGSEAEVH